MPATAPFLTPAEAAERLAISVKALRLYERRGLLAPVRTAAGWRAYGPETMARAAQIVGLRGLGLSLAQIGRVLRGEAADLEAALAAHQAGLEEQAHTLAATVAAVRTLRADLRQDRPVCPAAEPVIAFDLPWPWGGERFEMPGLPPLTYLTGPLGSGKTRLARHLAAAIPGAVFLELDRTPGARRADPAVVGILAHLAEDGAVLSEALTADGPACLVVDLVEQGLDQASQEALIDHLRRRPPGSRPLVLLTRSSAILDLTAVGPEDAILYCPANHGPPLRVAPRVGTPGYEAVATCLATPAVRARTGDLIVQRRGPPRLPLPAGR